MIQFFLRKSIVTICLNLSILLIGYFALPNIANEFIPAVEIPAVGVVFPTTVVHRDKVLNHLIKPVERQLLASGVVDKIETQMQRDRTILFIFFNWSLRPEEALQRARQIVSAFERPEGVLEPLFVLHRPTMSPILRLAYSGANVQQLTSILNSFSNDVERMEGVAGIQLNGATPEKGRILIDPALSAKYGIRTTNILESAAQRWSFRYLYENNNHLPHILQQPLLDLNDLKSMPVKNQKGKDIPLRWIADVKMIRQPAEVLFGKAQDAVVLEVIKSPGADALAIVDKVLKKSQKLQQQHPSLKSKIIYNEAEKIREAQSGVIQNFLLGILLNSIVLIIFLGSTIGAIIASCVFPTAILGTLFVMKSCDISLNIFALNGFSLASGMITDASIVVLESIMARFQKGEDLESSCDRGSRDVLIGVFASTLTTAAVIIPIYMQTGISAKLFSDLGLVLVATQFISLIAVFTFVPWLCSKTLSNKEERPKWIDILFKGSQFLVDSMVVMANRALQKSTRSKIFAYTFPVIGTVFSVVMFLLLPDSEFLPSVASNTYSLTIPVQRIKMKEQGPALQKNISNILGEDQSIQWNMTSKNTDTINAIFEFKKDINIQRIIHQVSQKLNIPKKRIVTAPVGPTPNTEPLSYDGFFYISHNLSKKQQHEFIKQFCQSPEILDCVSHGHYQEPKIALRPLSLNIARAQSNIVESTLNLASLVKTIDLSGLTNLPFSFPIEIAYKNKSQLLHMPLSQVSKKNTIEVSKVSSLYESNYIQGQDTLFRRDAQSYTPIYFRIQNATIGQSFITMDNVREKLKLNTEDVLPMGTLETMNETFEKMIGALVISAFLIFLILVIQFKSAMQAIIIMYSMPMAVGGAIAGLLIMGESMNVGVIVGFVLLVGIIVNNGILLMESINQRLSSGYELFVAIDESVKSRTRPILMTTCSTIFGMMPTMLLEAEGKELYQGMAIVNIFGMSLGTFLTLVVTPILIRMAMKKQTKEA